MERNQFWIFLALGLSIGACLEIMKAPTRQPVRLAGFTQFETLLEEGKVVHIVEEVKPVVKRRASHREEEPILPHKIASNEMPAESDIVPSPTPAPTTAKPLTPEEKKKQEEEAKKKKELEKKKRLKEKKKKEAIEKKQREALEAQAKQDEDDKKKDEKPDDAATPATDMPGSTITVQAPVPNDGLPKTVPEWEAYLMKDVDYERMAKFVQLFQTGIVKPEVYFPVIEAMLQDSRPGIRRLAVNGLASTPSAQTYLTLLEIRNDGDAGLRASVRSSLAQYSRLENLRFLMSVIAGQNDPTTVIEAMHVLQTSADTNVKSFTASAVTPGTATTGATGTATPATRAAAGNSLARYYAPFVPALKQIAQQNHDGGVRSTAVQTAAQLESLLAIISPARTTAAAN